MTFMLHVHLCMWIIFKLIFFVPTFVFSFAQKHTRNGLYTLLGSVHRDALSESVFFPLACSVGLVGANVRTTRS